MLGRTTDLTPDVTLDTPTPLIMMMVNGHDGYADYDDDVGEDLSKKGKTRLLGHQMAPLMSL